MGSLTQRKAPKLWCSPEMGASEQTGSRVDEHALLELLTSLETNMGPMQDQPKADSADLWLSPDEDEAFRFLNYVFLSVCNFSYILFVGIVKGWMAGTHLKVIVLKKCLMSIFGSLTDFFPEHCMVQGLMLSL